VLSDRSVAEDQSYFPRCWLHPATAERLGVKAGDLIELLAPDQASAPIRLAAAPDDAVGGDNLCVPASLRAFYDLHCGTAYTVRKLDRPLLQGAAANSLKATAAC
jgi:anaerobic selenocysteine-containing dehydrogenase